MIPLSPIASHSYRDFHASGVDYICLLRTPALTIKVYLFDQMAGAEERILTEVICPHDHRYDFLTTCIRGEVANWTYEEIHPDHDAAIALPRTAGFDLYDYDTPLNGGAGFRSAGERFLYTNHPRRYGPGESYFSPRADIHTISVKPDTILLLLQFADVPGIASTRTYFPRGVKPADLTKLYKPFKDYEAWERMEPVWPLLEPHLGAIIPMDRAS